MPPQMKRQNAFFGEPEQFREIACRICYQSEACGEWKRITCQCSIIHDYYHAHEFCLNKSKRCKVCATIYIEKEPESSCAALKDKIWVYYECSQAKIQEYNNQIISFMAIVVFIMLLFDLYQCTTLTKIDKSDLPALKEAEYIWLPVFDVKCYKSSPTSYIINFYSLAFLSFSMIFYYTVIPNI
ncbi:hypothetical protein BD770DRAFT_393966 [Pilaira anomala]|nr:hypothetical protein BD770DRAFT_393966 [Pilaira anomala]